MKKDEISVKPVYSFGDIVVDCGRYNVTRAGRPCRITPRAFEVLSYLIENRDRVVEKQELFDRIWQVSFVSDNALTRMIKEIRQVIGDDADAPRYIETSHRRGYRFIADVRSENPVPLRQNAATDRISIAVLPFANIGGDSDLEYLSEGISETIINHLAAIPSMKVTPRGSSFRCGDKSESPVDAGRELGVRYVLAGRIFLHNRHLIVKAELIEIPGERQIWGDQFQQDFNDLFKLQAEISGEISRELKLRLTGDDDREHRPGGEAYHSYLKGRYFWARRPEGTDKAIRYFEQAIELDPSYADAWAGLADCYSTLGSWENEMVAPRIAIPRAMTAITKALEIDGSKAEPHATLGYIKTHYDWDWADAEKSCRTAIELNPECTGAWHWLSHLMVALGRFDESLAACEKLLALDPLDVINSNHLGWHYYHARDYESALAQHKRTLELDPYSVWPHSEIGRTCEQLEMYDRAIDSFNEASRLSTSSFPVSGLGHALALAGRRSEAQQQIDKLARVDRYVSPFHEAVIRTGLGELPRAIDLLEKAFEERSGWLTYIKVDPRLDPLRDQSRFISLLNRIGLNAI